MWFRRMDFVGTADTFSIAVKKGQTVFLQCYTVNIRMGNFEQDLGDAFRHFLIPCDTSSKGLSPLSFTADSTTNLFFTPDSDNAATLTVMVLDA